MAHGDAHSRMILHARRNCTADGRTCASESPSECAGSVDTTSTVWPSCASFTASDADKLVLPTPPCRARTDTRTGSPLAAAVSQAGVQTCAGQGCSEQSKPLPSAQPVLSLHQPGEALRKHRIQGWATPTLGDPNAETAHHPHSYRQDKAALAPQQPSAADAHPSDEGCLK
eukprot:365596-Chlamydomonas_euryale.AAC.41